MERDINQSREDFGVSNEEAPSAQRQLINEAIAYRKEESGMVNTLSALETLPPAEIRDSGKNDNYGFHQPADRECAEREQRPPRIRPERPDKAGDSTSETGGGGGGKGGAKAEGNGEKTKSGNPAESTQTQTSKTGDSRPTEPPKAPESKPEETKSAENKGDLPEQVKEARAKYKEGASKLIEAASMSPTVQPGEGYYQVLKRMFPAIKPEELSQLANDTKRLNGGRTLHPGEQFQFMDKEQKLRLLDQVMNTYDAKHKTDALDIYGDFAAEKGKMAPVHNEVRNFLAGKIESTLGVTKPEPPKPNPEPRPEPKPEPAITPQNFSQEALKAFPKLDLDHNGLVDRQELQAAEQNKTLSTPEKAVATGMLNAESSLSKLADDTTGSEKGVSQRDLLKFGEIENQVAQEQADLNNVATSFANPQLFNMLDKNGNGRITKTELKDALAQGNLTPEDAASVDYLIENYKTAEKSTNDEFGFENSGVSRTDLLNLKAKLIRSKDNQLVNAVETGLIEAYLRSLKPPAPQASEATRV